MTGHILWCTDRDELLRCSVCFLVFSKYFLDLWYDIQASMVLAFGMMPLATQLKRQIGCNLDKMKSTLQMWNMPTMERVNIRDQQKLIINLGKEDTKQGCRYFFKMPNETMEYIYIYTYRYVHIYILTSCLYTYQETNFNFYLLTISFIYMTGYTIVSIYPNALL